MLRAMAEAVSERGFVRTPVAEVLRRAGVSRETFYQHFANKEECFLAAYDDGVMRLLVTIGGPLGEAGADPLDRLDEALRRYLAALAAEPALARTFLVEVYAAGPDALERRVAVQARFAEAVAGVVGAETPDERFTCEALVAAISALVTQRVCTGATRSLEELHEPLSRHARHVLTTMRES